LSLPKPLTGAELERYRIELERLMPEKRVVRKQAGPAPSGLDVVTVEGFDHVMIARRTAEGKSEQACIGSVRGGLEFVGGSRRGGETQ
jgi:hypothetical protein